MSSENGNHSLSSGNRKSLSDNLSSRSRPPTHAIYPSRHTRHGRNSHARSKLGHALGRNGMFGSGMSVSGTSIRRLRSRLGMTRSGIVLPGTTTRGILSTLGIALHLSSSGCVARSDGGPPGRLDGRRTRSPCASVASTTRRPCRATTARS